MAFEEKRNYFSAEIPYEMSLVSAPNQLFQRRVKKTYGWYTHKLTRPLIKVALRFPRALNKYTLGTYPKHYPITRAVFARLGTVFIHRTGDSFRLNVTPITISIAVNTPIIKSTNPDTFPIRFSSTKRTNPEIAGRTSIRRLFETNGTRFY